VRLHRQRRRRRRELRVALENLAKASHTALYCIVIQYYTGHSFFFPGSFPSSTPPLVSHPPAFLVAEGLAPGLAPSGAAPPGTEERWVQCKAVVVNEGRCGRTGKLAKQDQDCGKWRR